METNTVVLSLNDYNQLREFKEKMEEGNTYKLLQPYVSRSVYWGSEYHSPVNYITTDEAVIELLERNKELLKINTELKEEMVEMNRNSIETINKVKKMSIWEFIRWRKK